MQGICRTPFGKLWAMSLQKWTVHFLVFSALCCDVSCILLKSTQQSHTCENQAFKFPVRKKMTLASNR